MHNSLGWLSTRRRRWLLCVYAHCSPGVCALSRSTSGCSRSSLLQRFLTDSHGLVFSLVFVCSTTHRPKARVWAGRQLQVVTGPFTKGVVMSAFNEGRLCMFILPLSKRTGCAYVSCRRCRIRQGTAAAGCGIVIHHHREDSVGAGGQRLHAQGQADPGEAKALVVCR